MTKLASNFRNIPHTNKKKNQTSQHRQNVHSNSYVQTSFSFSLVPQLTITNADALVDEFFSMNSLKKYTWTVFFVLLWCTYYRLIRYKQKNISC